MRKLISKIADLPYRLAALVTVGIGAAASSAHATGVGGMADNIDTNLNSMGKLVVGGSFLAGIGLSGAGLLKLKAAADSQGQQVKYSEGLWRIGVGAGLASLPVVTQTGRDTLFGTGGDTGTTTEGTISIN